MNYLKFIVAAVIIIGGILIYAIIPGTIHISQSALAKISPDAASRTLEDDRAWAAWWPEKSPVGSNKKQEYVFEGKNIFYIERKGLNLLHINIASEGREVLSLLSYLPAMGDSIKILWSADIKTSINPTSRIQSYFFAKKIQRFFGILTNTLGRFLSDSKNIYGYRIIEDKIPFEYLVSAKQIFNQYPNTIAIYKMIDEAKAYIDACSGKQTGDAIINVKSITGIQFEAQIAISVSTQLPEKKHFTSKRMLKGGNVIVTQLTGGQSKINNALNAIELYVSDFKKTQIAIPFQQLITNRLSEPDSNKWVTKIYYPVMY